MSPLEMLHMGCGCVSLFPLAVGAGGKQDRLEERSAAVNTTQPRHSVVLSGAERWVDTWTGAGRTGWGRYVIFALTQRFMTVRQTAFNNFIYFIVQHTVKMGLKYLKCLNYQAEKSYGHQNTSMYNTVWFFDKVHLLTKAPTAMVYNRKAFS